MSVDFGQQFMPQRDTLITFLKNLDLQDTEIKVYLYGLSKGPQHVSRIAKSLDLSRPNTYNIIRKLKEKGLCIELGAAYGKRIQMVGQEGLERMLDRRIGIQQGLKLELHKLSSLLQQPQHVGISQPKVSYYEGQEGLQKLFEDQLYSGSSLIRIALSEVKLIDLLGTQFARHFVQERVRRGISSRALRKEIITSDDPEFSDHATYLREVRLAPPNVNLNTTVIMYAEKVAFLTSKHENFGTLIESQDYASTITSWFDAIWEIAT